MIPPPTYLRHCHTVTGRYFASRVSPLFRARILNSTEGLPFVLPSLGPQDILYFPDASGYNSGDWNKQFFNIAVGGVRASLFVMCAAQRCC